MYQWAEWTSREFQLTSLNLQSLRGLTGRQLCSLSQAELEAKTTPEYGSTLYQFIQVIKSLSSGGERKREIVCLVQPGWVVEEVGQDHVNCVRNDSVRNANQEVDLCRFSPPSLAELSFDNLLEN